MAKLIVHLCSTLSVFWWENIKIYYLRVSVGVAVGVINKEHNTHHSLCLTTVLWVLLMVWALQKHLPTSLTSAAFVYPTMSLWSTCSMLRHHDTNVHPLMLAVVMPLVPLSFVLHESCYFKGDRLQKFRRDFLKSYYHYKTSVYSTMLRHKMQKKAVKKKMWSS